MAPSTPRAQATKGCGTRSALDKIAEAGSSCLHGAEGISALVVLVRLAARCYILVLHRISIGEALDGSAMKPKALHLILFARSSISRNIDALPTIPANSHAKYEQCQDRKL